jgi:hypothetical protein
LQKTCRLRLIAGGIFVFAAEHRIGRRALRHISAMLIV